MALLPDGLHLIERDISSIPLQVRALPRFLERDFMLAFDNATSSYLSTRALRLLLTSYHVLVLSALCHRMVCHCQGSNSGFGNSRGFWRPGRFNSY